MNIVERIKTLQKEKDKKVSLNALEKQLFIGKSTISSWEKKQPSADKLEKLADYFNVSTDYLLGRTDVKEMAGQPPQPKEIVLENELDQKDMALVLAYNKLSPSKQKSLWDYIEILKKDAITLGEAKNTAVDKS